MRIVHFSDIHLAAKPHDPSAFIDKRILGMINYAVRRRRQVDESLLDRAIVQIRELKPDMVICTGDITCVGAPEEFAKARAKLEPLTASTEFDFFYIPGNHDAYVPRRKCQAALESTFRALNGNRLDLSQLPIEIKRDNLRLWLINQACPTIITSSCGFVFPQTARQLRDWVNSGRAANEVRILAGHFPTAGPEGKPLSIRRRLRGAEPVREALVSGGIDLYLCGHIHDCFVRRKPSQGTEICAGSLTMNAQLNIVDINERDGSWTQHWQKV
jgi:DNA repair exonuclease SbcCD nuclease subunit